MIERTSRERPIGPDTASGEAQQRPKETTNRSVAVVTGASTEIGYEAEPGSGKTQP
jgi:hypothetical protein